MSDLGKQQLNYFSVPYGRRSNGVILIAQVFVPELILPGQLERIGRQIQRIAPLAESTIPNEEPSLQQQLLLGEV